MNKCSIAITGAAGNIAYSLIFRILSGNIFMPDTKIDLRLLDIPNAKKILHGVKLEIEDCAFNSLDTITATDKPDVAFADCDYILLVGAKPRSKGMQRSDLILDNAHIFSDQGKIINKVSKKSAKIIVVGNPANTNALIVCSNTPDIPNENISSLMRLDQNRAKSILSSKVGQHVSSVTKLVVWGNHSTTQYPDISHAQINNSNNLSKIQKRFKCVLVDEFQDTDITQWNLIKKFFNTKNHFLLCVGDPKQAIYKFRGGDIETYLDARSNAIEVFSLTDNYRSSKKLIDVLNKLYKNGLKQSKLKYRKLTSRINGNINSEFKFKDVFEIVEFSKKDTVIEDLVTNYIVNFILNNKEIDINKIAILTLNNSQCLDFKNKFKEFNLPCKIQNKQNIFDTEASSLLFLFIECLLNPRSLKNINLLATSKFIEIKLEDLLDHGISNNLKILINKCITWSQELREKGFLNIVNELLINYKSSSIIQDSDLNSNLFQLSEIVEIELINNDFDLNIVFNWYKNQLDHILRISTGEDFLTKDYNLQNGINLSTIHSSKGLEFDIVLCPYLSIISNKSNKIKGPIWKSNIIETYTLKLLIITRRLKNLN